MSSEYSFAIDVPVRTEWRNVSLLVTSVQNCFNAMFANIEGSQTIAMVTGELLENAIKYGGWTGEVNVFHLRVHGSGKHAQVVVENPVGDEAGVEELVKTLSWLQRFPNAAEAYRARLLEIAQEPATPGESKLGLVRLAYEANCALAAEINAGVVRVRANLTV